LSTPASVGDGVPPASRLGGTEMLASTTLLLPPLLVPVPLPIDEADPTAWEKHCGPSPPSSSPPSRQHSVGAASGVVNPLGQAPHGAVGLHVRGHSSPTRQAGWLQGSATVAALPALQTPDEPFDQQHAPLSDWNSPGGQAKTHVSSGATRDAITSLHGPCVGSSGQQRFGFGNVRKLPGHGAKGSIG